MLGRRRAIGAAIVSLAACIPASAGEPFDVRADQADGPELKPWKTLKPDPAYHGQWLVAGDLDGDGIAEIVTARNDHQNVTAVVATGLSGGALWRYGKPGDGEPGLNYDVPVQLYDLNGDGCAEVFLSRERSLITLDGRIGCELRRWPLPDGLDVADCIVFANLRGLKRARDIIIKDRYKQLWAYTDDWEPLWHWSAGDAKTCHHPELVDIDGDGRDEVIAGYTLLDDDGHELWTTTSDRIDLMRGHLDCAKLLALTAAPATTRLAITCCGADRLALIDGAGRPLWELGGHHFESINAGRLRDDVPGVQLVVDVDHQPYGQGPLWIVSESGERLGTIVCGYARHHRLVDWDGDGLEDVVIGNARRVFNGRGECIARLGPDAAFADAIGEQKDNDPGPFVAVADMDGYRRPEIILHTTKTVVIYRSHRAHWRTRTPLGTGVNYTLY